MIFHTTYILPGIVEMPGSLFTYFTYFLTISIVAKAVFANTKKIKILIIFLVYDFASSGSALILMKQYKILAAAATSHKIIK